VAFSYNALSQRTQIARYQSTGTTNAVATSIFTFDYTNRLSGIAQHCVKRLTPAEIRPARLRRAGRISAKDSFWRFM